MSSIRSPFLSQFITSNFFSVLIVSRQFITSIALGYVDLCFSCILVTKSNFVGREVHQPHDDTTNIISRHVTDGMTVTSLSASLQGSSLPNDVKPKIIALALRSSVVIPPPLKTSVIAPNKLKES
jgi:hypothetical protein